ncbi:Ubiquitin-like domain - like 6 [Theobroma cacao]|nr:Ubiquitin-like domain - like 6 [Theobroma cacao]
MGAEGDSSESRLGGNGGEEEEGVMVNIRCSNGTKFTVRTSLDSTVASFKAVLAQNCDIPADQQRLIYKGRILKDDQTLQSYGLQADHSVHMVRGFAPSSSTPPAATTNVGTPNTTTGVTRGVGSNEGAGLGAPLFPGLNPLGGGGGGGGGLGLFGAGLPEFEQVQQQLTQNPNMMREIMNTPAIQGLMNNPELMRSLIMSNPQMREIIDRNPELGHILNDPSILRQTLEAARNPELMREMMRNTDRAMSNIESSPEGFNMLRRMYENVQEPFLNATTMAGNSGNAPGSNPFAALLGNQGGSQARDSPNNTSTAGSDTTQGQTAPNTNPLPNPWSNTGGGGGGVTQTNTTARSNPAGDVRTPGIGGLGGLGLPDMPPMLNGMPDASHLTQMLQDPALSQMMQSILSNPQYMNQIMNLNPQLRGMFDLNPQLREMMQNPDILRQMFSPETMQQMLALQQSLLSHQLNRQQSTQDSAQPGATPALLSSIFLFYTSFCLIAFSGAPNTASLELLMNMFGGLGAGSLSVPNQPDVPPEELYATQLSQLQEMGFYDTQENIRALRATAGNVHAAVERLLGNSGQ